MIMAIVRTTGLERIVKSLEEEGIRSVTVSEVKGTGEQVQIFKPYTIHKRLDIIVPDEKADMVTSIILEQAHTGFAGDGLIAVFPVDYIVRIRTKSKIDDDNF